LFQVVIETFIGIQLRRIAGQARDLDDLRMLFEPLLNRCAVMHPEVIEDQEDLGAVELALLEEIQLSHLLRKERAQKRWALGRIVKGPINHLHLCR
jgi:hypothetical protein